MLTITKCTDGLDIYIATTDSPDKVAAIMRKYGCIPFATIRPGTTAGEGRVKLYIRPGDRITAIRDIDNYELADPFKDGYEEFAKSFEEMITDGQRKFKEMMVELAPLFTSRCVVRNISFSPALDKTDGDSLERMATDFEGPAPKQKTKRRKLNRRPFGEVIERIQKLGRSIRANLQFGRRPCPAEASMQIYLRIISREELFMAFTVITIGDNVSGDSVDVIGEYVDVCRGHRSMASLVELICHEVKLPELIENGIRRIESAGINLDDFTVLQK